LKQRAADIPEIFVGALTAALSANHLSVAPVLSLFGGDHFEAMCLDGFVSGNVRGILDLTDRLVSKMVTGIVPKEAVASVFVERFGTGPVSARYTNRPVPATPQPRMDAAPPDKISDVGGESSHYELHRAEITEAFMQCEGNLSATERMLKSAGIRCTRRWIGVFAKKWGLR
jgi:hypothetical protein